MLREIDVDLASPYRMLRLLQGDVGSGKTVVALLAMATAVEAGAQAAFMAPTELLARQHQDHRRVRRVDSLRIALLSGREKGAERKEILAALAEGRIDILIGTHALFQEPVAFRRSRAGGDRRAASLRRASAARAAARDQGAAPSFW